MKNNSSQSSRKKTPASAGGSARHIRLRYLLVATLIVVVSGLIVRSAVLTTVVHADKWNDKANKELEKTEIILPTRGDILACDGSVLATNLTYYNAFIDFRASRFMVDEFRKSLDRLADTLAIFHPQRTRDEWYERLNRQINLPDSARTSSFLLLRNLTYDEWQRLKTFPFFRLSRNPNKTGLVVDSHLRRCYPYGDMARRSVGRVGQTDSSSEIHGISGLEYALDSLLYGAPGRARKVPLTHKIADWTDIPPRHGYTLTTTIDIAMQDIVENELNNILRESEAEWGTAILMEVQTGDIKAISNLERDSLGNYIEAQNYALLGFEPGSVMKVPSMVIALEDGFAPDLDKLYDTPSYGYVYGGGSPIKDSHSPAQLPVRKFLCYSSNIGMTKLVAPHFEEDPNGFRERLRKLGFLDSLKTGIAGERPPYFPTLDKKSGGLVSLGRQTYGYASMVPPLYTCAFYNAVANDGKFVRPRIVSRISSEHFDSILPVTYVRQQMCSPQTARTVRQMLHDVIYEKGGTARNIANDKVEFAGKTGTARVATVVKKSDRESAPADSASKAKGYSNKLRFAFCGFFPYEAPRYTCMVLISNATGRYRSPAASSATVFRNIALKMFSRGMLGNSSDYHTGETTVGSRPTVFANTSRTRIDNLKSMLGAQAVNRIKSPATGTVGIPDVRGLSVRDAIVALENAGYNVAINGNGYVYAQNPPPGTPGRRGTKVMLTLSSAAANTH